LFKHLGVDAIERLQTLWKKDHAGDRVKLKKGWGEDGSWYHGVVYETRITIQNVIVYACKFDTPTREILNLDTTRTLELIKAYEDLQAYESDSDGLSSLFEDATSTDATRSTCATVVVGTKIRIAVHTMNHTFHTCTTFHEGDVEGVRHHPTNDARVKVVEFLCRFATAVPQKKWYTADQTLLKTIRSIHSTCSSTLSTTTAITFMTEVPKRPTQHAKTNCTM
jgi:hypothetical protein